MNNGRERTPSVSAKSPLASNPFAPLSRPYEESAKQSASKQINADLNLEQLLEKLAVLETMSGTRNAVRRIKRRIRDIRCSNSNSSAPSIVRVAASDRTTVVEPKNPPRHCSNVDDNILTAPNPLKPLNVHMLTYLCGMHLDARSIAALGSTCRSLRDIVNEGSIWRILYRKRLGGIVVTDSIDSRRDWKRQYALSARRVYENLTCYHTLATPHDDIVGLPIDFTVHPVRKKVDHIFVPNDGVLSFTAYDRLRCRQSAWGVSIKGFVPLFVSADHFEEAYRRRIVHQAFAALSPRSSFRFKPEMALTALTKLFSTMVILLSKEGIACCDRAFRGYIHFWRLLIAIMEKHPELQSKIRSRLTRFARFPSMRVKKCEPSLGELLPLLAVSPDVTWIGEFSKAYMSESFDRGVLWMCRSAPELAEPERRKQGRGADAEWLTKSFESRKIALKIAGLHVAFAHVLAGSKKRIESAAERIDYFLGQAPTDIVDALKARVKKVMAADTWATMLDALDMKAPSDAKLTDMLKQSVENSLRKKYHTEGMDFSRVMRHGSSHILLRGQTMSLGHLARLEVRDTWRWDGTTKFLDATAMFFDFSGEHQAILDYQQTRAFGRAATHSGDVMEHGERKGFHRIRINLRQLPESIQYVYIVLSSYQGEKLNAIKLPSVSVSDVQSRAVVCDYTFETRENLDEHSSVVMCRLWRSSPGASWKVDALGHLGDGEASCYDPIVESIQNSILREKGVAVSAENQGTAAATKRPSDNDDESADCP
eukprot:g1382.t1